MLLKTINRCWTTKPSKKWSKKITFFKHLLNIFQTFVILTKKWVNENSNKVTVLWNRISYNSDTPVGFPTDQSLLENLWLCQWQNLNLKIHTRYFRKSLTMANYVFNPKFVFKNVNKQSLWTVNLKMISTQLLYATGIIFFVIVSVL